MSTSGTIMTSSIYEEQPESQGVANPSAVSLGRLSSSTLSMRHKKQRKRCASAHHNSNFHAGYVPVTEEILHRSGIRGRKRYFLYCTLTILLVVAFVNTLVTAWLLYILGMTHTGIANLEMMGMASGSLIRFLAPTFASSIVLNGAPAGSRQYSNFSLTSHNSDMYMNSFKSSSFSPNLTLTGEHLIVTADEMIIKSTQNKNGISLDIQTVAEVHGISNFAVESLITKKLQNHKNVNDLILESPKNKVLVNGSKGVDVESMKDIEINGGKDVVIQSDNAVIFKSKHSIYLDPSLPKSPDSSTPQSSKMCMCGNGQLFLVPINNPASTSSLCDIGRDEALRICKMGNHNS